MKIFKILLITCCTIFFLWFGQYIYPLFMIYLNDVILSTPYEKDGSDRPVAREYIGKTYELKQELFLARFGPASSFYLLDRFSIENDTIVPIEMDITFADYLKKLEKSTKFTIKKVGIEALRFQGELPIPRFYALVSGYEDKGLIDVSALLRFDFTHFDEKQKEGNRQIAIMESVHPDENLIELAH